MENTTICSKIDEAIKLLTDLKSQINSPTQMTQPIVASQDEFSSLKEILLSDKWPVSVNPNLICNTNSEEDKKERGLGIVELLIEEQLTKNDKFLDYGCGEGHCVTAAVETLGCAFAVGYDKTPYNWPDVPNTKFTSSYEDMASLGPYNAIMLFDVLDHVENETATDLLKKVTAVLAPNGKIYARCHPWISRHGTHLYHKLNKAYAHIVFTPEELAQLSDHVPDNNLFITTPINSYKKLFESANLKIVNERKITEKIEPFFKTPKISDRILKNTKHSNFPEFQMSLQFIDYILQK